MEQIELNAEVRSGVGKRVAHIRAEGYVPAVVYGSQRAATPIQVESRALHKALARAGGNTLIRLQVAGSEPVAVLAREVQRDTLKHDIIHVDFQQVVMTEKISAEIPLRLVGESPAVRDLAGILVHGIDRLEVHCLPGDMPPAIDVDLGQLVRLHDAILVSSLQLPAAVTVVSDAETVIARVEAPRISEGVEGEIAAPTSAEPELVGRRDRAAAEED